MDDSDAWVWRSAFRMAAGQFATRRARWQTEGNGIEEHWDEIVERVRHQENQPGSVDYRPVYDVVTDMEPATAHQQSSGPWTTALVTAAAVIADIRPVTLTVAVAGPDIQYAAAVAYRIGNVLARTQ